MDRLALIVKYFPPGERISGLTSLTALLAQRLAARGELHILTHCDAAAADQWSRAHGYQVKPVAGPFWLRVGSAIRKLAPRGAVVLSGVYTARGIYPAFRALAGAIQTVPNGIFFQGVNLNRRPGPAGRSVLRRFRRIVATGPALMELLGESFADRLTYVPPGVDVDRIRAVPPADKGAPFRVGYFSHFKWYKGVDLALAAFASQPFADTEYAVAGTGQMGPEMREKYDGRGGIRFLGYLDDPMSELKACDVMVLPFRTSVSVLGISQTALECLAAGVPVIGSRIAAITAAVRHEVEGLIYDRPDEVPALIRRLHDDADLRTQLARNALRRAEAFRIDDTADKLLALMREDAT